MNNPWKIITKQDLPEDRIPVEIWTDRNSGNEWYYIDGKFYPKLEAYKSAGIQINKPIAVGRLEPTRYIDAVARMQLEYNVAVSNMLQSLEKTKTRLL